MITTEPIIFATMLWRPNAESRDFSRMYNETWVDKLYRGFKRNTTRPFQFHVWVDRDDYAFESPVVTHRISDDPPGYSSFIQPFELDRPMILVGLDTVITGSVDDLVDYCFTGSRVALPDDPYRPSRICNGVALIPRGFRWVYDTHDGENDMEWLRGIPYARLDGLFPGACQSYKVHVKPRGEPGDARIVYFHGKEKPHELPGVAWIAESWR